MRKVTAILLLALLFFNWYGYRIITTIAYQSANKQLETRLDNNDYAESQLIEVRIPLNIPYQNNETDFERYYGEVEVEGTHYTYVKRKIEDGVLVLKCIRNTSRNAIEEVGNNYFKTANGLDSNQPDNKQSNSSTVKAFWGEYEDRLEEYTLTHAYTTSINNWKQFSSHITEIYSPVPGHPPKHA